MSEKLYRIKPLVWKEDSVNPNWWWTEGVFGHYTANETGAAFHADSWPTKSAVLAPQMHPLSDQQAICQRDYEQRLISAGVVEEVS